MRCSLETYKILDDSYEDWIKSINAHPVLGPEYQKMLLMHHLLEGSDHPSESPDVRFGRFYQSVYEPSDSSIRSVVRGLRMASARLKTFDRLLLVEHAPKEFLGRLSSESRVAHTFSPVDLIDTAFSPRGADRLSARRQREALPRYIMSRMLFWISEVESEIDVGEQAEDAFDTIIQRLFAPGESSRLFLRVWLDPNDDLRCKKLAYALDACPVPEHRLDWVEQTHEIDCRFLLVNDRRIPVIFDDRVKDDFATTIKVMRKGVPLVQQVDKRGLTIIALTSEDLGILEESFQVAVNIAPFSVREPPHGRPESVVDPTNPYSCIDFKARRYELDFKLPNGTRVPVEANLQLGQHYADTLFSHTAARHSVYRLNQLCDQYFPFRFPRFICGVDFRDGSANRKKMLNKLW